MVVNFRLEMSRLHAEWLIEQKSAFQPKNVEGMSLTRSEYAEALTWDQLKLTMKDSNPYRNPLTGFEEGPIDFPPTFKVSC